MTYVDKNMICARIFKLKMGSGNSIQKHVDFEETAETSEFWYHHRAFDHRIGQSVSILVSENADNVECLKKLDENLKMLRHPYIVKFLMSWQTTAYNIMIEDVKPLRNVIYNNSNELILEPLQVSLGLWMITKGLQFLHEKAKMSHNNLSLSAIYYATETNCWKIGSFQCACKFGNLNLQYYNNIIAKFRQNEQNFDNSDNEKLIISNEEWSQKWFLIDCYSFGRLLMQLSNNIVEFKTVRGLCEERFLNADLKSRTSIGITEFFQWKYFQNDFLEIYQFLIELPIKNDDEKIDFHQTLLERLQKLPEKIVAADLGRLLLSRFVLTDKYAHDFVVPILLLPRKEGSLVGLFNENIFRKYFVPHLLKIFQVHVVEIRLLLLEYFEKYVYCIPIDDLRNDVLPTILLGIKDENELLVQKTLYAIATMIPILGSDVVVGKTKRSKIFRSYEESKLKLLPNNTDSDFKSREEVIEDWCEWNDFNEVEPDVQESNTISEMQKKHVEVFKSVKDDFNCFIHMEPKISNAARFFVEDSIPESRLNSEAEVLSFEETVGWDDYE